jgi:hypothetical protein
MISPRMLERLEKTADAFEVQRDPFSAEWLTQNNITVQESFDLPERIGRILRDHRLSHKEEGNR